MTLYSIRYYVFSSHTLNIEYVMSRYVYGGRCRRVICDESSECIRLPVSCVKFTFKLNTGDVLKLMNQIAMNEFLDSNQEKSYSSNLIFVYVWLKTIKFFLLD